MRLHNNKSTHMSRFGTIKNDREHHKQAIKYEWFLFSTCCTPKERANLLCVTAGENVVCIFGKLNTVCHFACWGNRNIFGYYVIFSYVTALYRLWTRTKQRNISLEKWPKRIRHKFWRESNKRHTNFGMQHKQ